MHACRKGRKRKAKVQCRFSACCGQQSPAAAVAESSSRAVLDKLEKRDVYEFPSQLLFSRAAASADEKAKGRRPSKALLDFRDTWPMSCLTLGSLKVTAI